jgi:hypothetical protein
VRLPLVGEARGNVEPLEVCPRANAHIQRLSTTDACFEVDSTKRLSRIASEPEPTGTDFCVRLREESNPVSFLLSSDWTMVGRRPTMVYDGFIYWEAGGVIHVCLVRGADLTWMEEQNII